MGASNSTHLVKQENDVDSFEIKPLYLLKKELILELGLDINPQLSLLKKKNKRVKEPESQLGHPHLMINDELYERERKPFQEGQFEPPVLSKRIMDPYNKFAHLENTESDTSDEEDNKMKGGKKVRKDHQKKHRVGYNNYVDRSHFFKTFIEYRFMESFRQNLTDNNFWGHYRRDLYADYKRYKKHRLDQMKYFGKEIKVTETRTLQKAQVISSKQLQLMMKTKKRSVTLKPARQNTIDIAPSPKQESLLMKKQSTKYFNVGHVENQFQFQQNANDILEKARQNTLKTSDERQKELMPLEHRINNDITQKQLLGIINTGKQEPSPSLPKNKLTTIKSIDLNTEADKLFLKAAKRRQSKSMDSARQGPFSLQGNIFQKIKKFFNRDADDDQMQQRIEPQQKPILTGASKNSKYKRKTDINATLRRRNQSVTNLQKLWEQLEQEKMNKKTSILDVAASKTKGKSASPMKTDVVKKLNRFDIDPNDLEDKYQNDNKEKNILVTTWIDDLKQPQYEMQRRDLFFVNESLLLRQNLNDHFNNSHIVKLFYQTGLEFVCLKGNCANLYSKQNHFEAKVDENKRTTRIRDLQAYKEKNNDRSMNQDSFFSVVDGNLKMIGVFDGHGEQGHLISSAASAHMLDYLRNRNDVFKSKNLHSATPEQIEHEIKCAFKYTQNVLREDFLIGVEKKKNVKRKTQEKQKKNKQNPFQRRQQIQKQKKDKDGIQDDQNSDLDILSNKYSNNSSQNAHYINDLNDKYEMLKETMNLKEYKQVDDESEWEQEDKIFWYQDSKYQSEKSQESGNDFREKDRLNVKYGKRRYKMNLNLKINKRRLLKEVKRDLIEKAFKKINNKSIDTAENPLLDQVVKIPHEKLRQSLEVRVLIEKLNRIRQIKRELDIMHRSHRTQQLIEKNSFQVINKKPEIRFQVQRQSQRQIVHNKLMIQDKTKDQFCKYKKMKQLLLQQQQSRLFTEKGSSFGDMPKQSMKRSFTMKTPAQIKETVSNNSSILNTVEAHEGGSSLETPRKKQKNLNSSDQKLTNMSKQDKLKLSVKETLLQVEENKNNNQVKPFEFNVDVCDEEFLKSPGSDHENDNSNESNSLQVPPPENEDELSLQDSESSLNKMTEIHISDEDEEGELAQMKLLQEGGFNFGLKDLSDDSIQAEIEEQLLYEEDIIQQYKLLGSDTESLVESLIDSDEDSDSLSKSDSSGSSSNSQASSFDSSSDLDESNSNSLNSSNDSQSASNQKKKSKKSSIMRSSMLSESLKSQRTSKSCTQSSMSTIQISADKKGKRLMNTLYQYETPTTVFERKKQQAMSLQNQSKLCRTKTTLELQYDRMELNKFNRDRQAQLKNVSKKKFRLKNEDKKQQIMRIRQREFRKRVTCREKQEFNLDIAMSGTTATLVIIYDGVIYYGWVGDSMACLSKPMNACSQKNIQNNELILTLPIHTPMDQHEKMRIYRKKGEIRNEKPKEKKSKGNEHQQSTEELSLKSYRGSGQSQNDKEAKDNKINQTKIEQLRKIEKQKKDFQVGQFDPATCPRIYNRGRMYPGLQISRSLGDYLGHRIGVTSEPGVGSLKFTKHNEYLVIASRSLWNEMSPKEVFEFIKMHSNYEQLGTVPYLLAAKVRDSCQSEALNPIQDITIIIQSLNANIAKFK